MTSSTLISSSILSTSKLSCFTSKSRLSSVMNAHGSCPCWPMRAIIGFIGWPKTGSAVITPRTGLLVESTCEMARAISQVLSTNKPVLDVMTALPVFGQPMNPMMARMGQQGQDPWAFITELKRDFEVKQLNFDVD